MNYDWEEIFALLQIVNGCRDHPNLKAIYDAANTRLNEIADPPKEEVIEEKSEDAPEKSSPEDNGKSAGLRRM